VYRYTCTSVYYEQTVHLYLRILRANREGQSVSPCPQGVGRAAAMTRNGSGKNGSARYRAKFVAPFSRQMRLLCGRLLRNMYRHPFLLKVGRCRLKPAEPPRVETVLAS
jgi:hypothetical protein